MLNLLVGWRPFDTEIKGNKISMELKPLSKEAMLILAPELSKETNRDDKTALWKETFEMQKLASSVFPDHVRNVAGLKVNNKVPSWKQFAEEVALSELSCTIIGELCRISSLTETEAKN